MGGLLYSREIDVKYDVDICVAGGGPAGVAAAVMAAREGASVYLAEQQGFFGGAATAALIPAFMPFDNGVQFMAGGFGKEVYDLCIRNGFVKSGRSLGIHAEKYKLIMDKMVHAEKNIKFSFFTTLIDVMKDKTGGRVEYALFNAKSGTFAVKAKLFIDCTGDGDLSVMAGAAFDMGDDDGNCMPTTLCSIWNNVDWDKNSGWQGRELERAFSDGVFTQEDRHLPGMWKTGYKLGGGNIGHSFGVDATDELSLTEAMLTGRAIMPEYELYYNKYLGGAFEESGVAITGSYLGVRESRRIIGDYILSFDDFLNRAKFHDDIGRFSYPIDIHIAKPNKEAFEAFHKEHTTQRYNDGETYGIPYRILTPKGLENVYVAGRCVSADKKMQSSVRVIPACFLMGQAAGIGAAMSVFSGVNTTRGIDVGALIEKLEQIGTFSTEVTG